MRLGGTVKEVLKIKGFGKKNTESLKSLLRLLAPFDIRFFCADNFNVYHTELPVEKHIVWKLYTQRIERQNLNLRTRLKRLNRKTIGFSKSTELHDKVIDTFIEREFH